MSSASDAPAPSELAARVRRRLNARAEPEGVAAKRWAFREAAALLSYFDPTRLRLRGDGAEHDALITLLDDCEVIGEPTRGVWTLKWPCGRPRCAAWRAERARCARSRPIESAASTPWSGASTTTCAKRRRNSAASAWTRSPAPCRPSGGCARSPASRGSRRSKRSSPCSGESSCSTHSSRSRAMASTAATASWTPCGYTSACSIPSGCEPASGAPAARSTRSRAASAAR